MHAMLYQEALDTGLEGYELSGNFREDETCVVAYFICQQLKSYLNSIKTYK